MPSEDNIVVSSLSRLFASKYVVNNVSFSVRQGQILGLLGPNGAGKSTTLQMISGALAPSSGQISICGVDLLTQPKLAKSRIGFLPEIPPVYPDFTVDDYLRFCARIRQLGASRIKSAISEVKQKCGLSDVGKRLIGNLSKGFQQRVGIAQAIIHNPNVVILDEPTVGLDPIQIREIRELIKVIGKEQSVILSSHILPEIQTTCDSVQIINHGRVVFNDTVENLSHHMESPSLLVGLNNPPPLQQIEQLESIFKVEKANDKLLRVHHNQSCDTAQLLVENSVTKNWGLYHIGAEQRSLEEIFVDITTTDPLADNSASENEVEVEVETNVAANVETKLENKQETQP